MHQHNYEQFKLSAVKPSESCICLLYKWNVTGTLIQIMQQMCSRWNKQTVWCTEAKQQEGWKANPAVLMYLNRRIVNCISNLYSPLCAMHSVCSSHCIKAQCSHVCVLSYRRRGCAVLWHHAGSLHLQQPLWRVHETHQAGSIRPLPAPSILDCFEPPDSRNRVLVPGARWLNDQPAVTLIGVVWGHPSWHDCLVSQRGFSLEDRLQISTQTARSVTLFGSVSWQALVIWSQRKLDMNTMARFKYFTCFPVFLCQCVCPFLCLPRRAVKTQSAL